MSRDRQVSRVSESHESFFSAIQSDKRYESLRNKWESF